MLRGQDDAGPHLALWRARHDVYEIDHEFRVRMGDNGQIGILAIGHLLTDLDIQLIVGCLFRHEVILGKDTPGLRRQKKAASIPVRRPFYLPIERPSPRSAGGSIARPARWPTIWRSAAHKKWRRWCQPSRY